MPENVTLKNSDGIIVIDSADDYRRIRDRKPPVVEINGYRIPIPCGSTMLVKTEMVVANTYNPNSVPSDKLMLLRQSILDNGFCFPVVTIWDDEQEIFVIVDGFHRWLLAGKEWLKMPYVPVVCLPHDINQRMAATIQFNKARGVHQIDLDADVVSALLQQGMGEEEISTHLGMDLDTVHRYKQLTGIAGLFKNAEYSIAWEISECPDEE